jgi:hypothetical protein
MEILWNENPLKTSIDLDKNDIEIFRLKLRIEHLTESAYSAYFHLKNETSDADPTAAAKALSTLEELFGHDNSLSDDPPFFEVYLTELKKGYHCGDCTCVPASCAKCAAEEILGVNTIKGLGKHQARLIDSAFNNGANRTIDDVIDYLERYEPKNPGGQFAMSPEEIDKLMNAWRSQARSARDWLIQYNKNCLGIS